MFLELLDPLTAVNNLAVCMRLDGALEAGRLEESANRILARHEALRTSFATEEGRSLPRIASVLTMELAVVDLQLQDTDRQVEALRLAELEARRPFALSRPPLLRAKLYRLALDQHVLLVVVHHTIADGWSLGVFLQELFSFYQRPAAALSALPIQYADFASWQRQSMDGPLLQAQLLVWKQQLAGALPVLDLPIDHPRPPRQTFSGGTHRFRLPVRLTRDVREVSRQHDVTVFMTLVAAFQTLLHRYCGQDDVLIGTPIAGRTRPETEELIGAFINTLVLRTDLSGDPTFRELLQQVRKVALAAYAHQDVPFEKLVAELRPQRDLSRTPIFQAMFVLQNSPLPPLRIPGLSLQLLPIDRGAAQFDLTLIVMESDGGLDGVFEYNADLFDASTIGRLSDSFELLLRDAVARPEQRLSRLQVMTEAEQRHLVVELNDTQADYPREQCVHELFEAQVERTPGGVAVICDGTQITYRDLDCWANMLAGELQDLGVGPDVRVGVYLERSLELVAALLAVLKAGGAYVPIDPSCPPDRVKAMLRDSNARVLLTQESLKPSGTDNAIVVNRSRDAERGSRNPVRPAARPGMTSRNLAYVIYTSGSTGQPKGVLVPHNALVNLLWSMRQLFGLGSGDTALAVTSISFDIAALEVYLPLIVGATVVLASCAMARDRRALQAAIVSHDVRVMQATPATWRMMLEGGWRGHANLVALSGGEPLSPELAKQLLKCVGSLWNLYGPTETTVWSSAGQLREAQRPITIGRPIANTQLHVLDGHLQPVPAGVTGELHIGGDGVSLGYLNRPELTAEKFIPNPFTRSANQEDRLFKTGDRARHLADGGIEILGRLDQQVKINGFRIELGEIEAALSRHASVREAVVIARDKILVAYFVPAEGPLARTGEFRDFLRTMLPAYMVPAVFVPLPELPVTVAGKVDRLALPATNPSAADSTIVAPQTPLEEFLAATYAQVLGVDRIGVHDNFFDLGGGSIQILEIIVRAEPHRLTISPEAFFEHQTVSELASFLSRR